MGLLSLGRQRPSSLLGRCARTLPATAWPAPARPARCQHGLDGVAGAVAPAVEPLLAAAARVDEPLLLVEPQRPGADAQLLGEVPDGEDVPAGRPAVELGHE